MKLILFVTLLFPCLLLAWDSDVDWLQQQQLNRSSQLALERHQQARPGVPAPPGNAQFLFDQQQRMSQSLLQEAQRRRQLIEQHRRNVQPADVNAGQRWNFQQQRSRQEQLYQLDRFRMQQQLRRQ